MIVYVDIFSGDEFCSDALQPTVVGDVMLEIQTKMIDPNGDMSFLPPGDEEDGPLDDASEQVLNIVHSHKLQEIALDKKGYLTWVKRYMARIVESMQSSDPDRVDAFKASATAFLKAEVLPKLKDAQFWVGESYDAEACIAIAFYEGESITPKFWIWKDGMKEVKY